MNPKFKCFGCGHIWYSKEILAICPICRGKGVKIKERVKMDNNFKVYCPVCKIFYYGWEKEKICPICRCELLDKES